MRRTFFLNEFQSLGEGQYRVQCLRVGQWDYDGLPGGLNVTPELLAELERNFKAGHKGFEVPLNREHDAERPCGWVKSVELAPDGQSMYAVFDITDPETQKLVDDGSLKYCSSEMVFDWWDPEAKTELAVLEGLALTNYPYLKRMDPVERIDVDLSESAAATNDVPRKGPRGNTAPIPTGGNMDKDEKNPPAAPGGDNTARLSEAEQKLKSLEVQLAEREKAQEAEKAKLTEEIQRLQASQTRTHGQLRLASVRAKLAACARKGRITPYVYGRVLALAEALVLSGTSTVQLAEKVKLKKKVKGEEVEEDVDKLDVIDELVDIMQEMPDSIAIDSDTAELDEDSDDDKAKDDDDDEETDKAVQAKMKESGKPYNEAYRLVMKDRNLAGGKR